MPLKKNAKRKKSKKGHKNGYIFFNVLAVIILIVSFIVHFWITQVRVDMGYFSAPSWVINVDFISGSLLNATLIGWIAGNIISKAKKR